MRWSIIFLLLSVLTAAVLCQDSSEESVTPKRVLKKYRVRRPVVVDDSGNVVRAGPRLRRVRVKNPRPTNESPSSTTASPQIISSTISPTPQAFQSIRYESPTAQPQPRTIQQLYYEDQQNQQVIEQARTNPQYRTATSSQQRNALLANVNYKSRGTRTDFDFDKKVVGTTKNYSHINEDGSFTFGYEAEDGSFKEETRGLDCVARGKYGYIDPDGVRRELTYVSGNPCDPNDPNKDEQEEEEDSLPPSRPILRQRVRPESASLQGLEQTLEEKLNDEQLSTVVRQPQRVRVRPQIQPTQQQPQFYNPTTFRPRIRITSPPPTLPPRNSEDDEANPSFSLRQRPFPLLRRPLLLQEPSQSIDDQGLARGRSISNSFNFDQELQRLNNAQQQQQQQFQQGRPLYEQPTQPISHYVSSLAHPPRQVFGQSNFIRDNQNQQTQNQPEPSSRPQTINPNFGRYRTELVYDPNSGQYTSVHVQAMPHSNDQIELTQKLQGFVDPDKSRQLQVSRYNQPQIQYYSPQPTQATQQQQTIVRPQSTPQPSPATTFYYQRQGPGSFQTLEQQPQGRSAQPTTINNLQFIPPHLRPQQPTATQPQPQYTSASAHQSHSAGQIDAFLRSLNIAI